jgi:hypothetical protein
MLAVEFDQSAQLPESVLARVDSPNFFFALSFIKDP